LFINTACRKNHESAYHLIHLPYLRDDLSTGDSLLKVYPERKQPRSFTLIIDEHIHYSQQVLLAMSTCQLTSIMHTILNNEDTEHIDMAFCLHIIKDELYALFNTAACHIIVNWSCCIPLESRKQYLHHFQSFQPDFRGAWKIRNKKIPRNIPTF